MGKVADAYSTKIDDTDASSDVDPEDRPSDVRNL